jgi:PAS domain S-box-containing protein
MINNSPEVSPNGKIELFTQPANGSAARQLPPAIAALKQEITTRKQTEAALKASEELFRHVINSISDHIYVTRIRADGSRVNLYLSPHVQALTGYPMEKFINNWDFWPSTVIHPKDQARATVQAQALAAGEDSEVEYRLVRADGSIIWVRDSGRVTRTPATGELTVYGIISNVSRRKLAELENMWLHNQFHRQAEEIEQYANRLNVFYELDRAIATKLRPDDIYHAFSAHAARLLPYDCMTIALAKDSSWDAREKACSSK